jgi:hypothetical protein
VFLFLLAASVLRADRLLDQVRSAQATLGTDVWSRVIRVENETQPSRYPRTLHALVFEFGGILWFYTPVDGTQSFSLHRDRLEEEKSDFGPLLKDVDPGFVRWTVVAGTGRSRPRRGGELPNGCFIDSVAALHDRRKRGEVVGEPRLLSYYVATPDGMSGHTVLALISPDRVEVIDAAESARPRSFARPMGGDAAGLAMVLAGETVVKARWIPAAEPPEVREGAFAGGGAGDSPMPGPRELAVR